MWRNFFFSEKKHLCSWPKHTLLAYSVKLNLLYLSFFNVFLLQDYTPDFVMVVLVLWKCIMTHSLRFFSQNLHLISPHEENIFWPSTDISVSALQFYVPAKWNAKQCLAGTRIQTTNALIAKLVWTEMWFMKSFALPVWGSLHVCKYTVSSRNCCDSLALLFTVVADSCSTHCLTHWKIKGVLPRNKKLGPLFCLQVNSGFTVNLRRGLTVV